MQHEGAVGEGRASVHMCGGWGVCGREGMSLGRTRTYGSQCVYG